MTWNRWRSRREKFYLDGKYRRIRDIGDIVSRFRKSTAISSAVGSCSRNSAVRLEFPREPIGPLTWFVKVRCSLEDNYKLENFISQTVYSVFFKQCDSLNYVYFPFKVGIDTKICINCLYQLSNVLFDEITILLEILAEYPIRVFYFYKYLRNLNYKIVLYKDKVNYSVIRVIQNIDIIFEELF